LVLSSVITGMPALGSVTTTLSIVTLPVLVTVNVYSIVLPSADSTPVFSKLNDGLAGTSTVVLPGSAGSVGVGSTDGTGVIGLGGLAGSVVGGVPVTVAELSTPPASLSAWVNTYVAV